LWVDKYAPQDVTDLAVHKRKILEVQNWLQGALVELRASGTRPWLKRILILTGPPGVGKTTTLRLVAKQLDIPISEWINPVHLAQDINDTSYATGEARKFELFIRKADRYTPLAMATPTATIATPIATPPEPPNQQLVVIEDFPNLTQPATKRVFEDCLRHYTAPRPLRAFPLVLIISECISRHSLLEEASGGPAGRNGRSFGEALENFRQVIPRDVLDSPLVTRINFNPIAPTLLTKALKRIWSLECHCHPWSQNRRPLLNESAVLPMVVAECHGDIRNALNTLQLTSRTLPSSPVPGSAGSSRSRPGRPSGGRESSFDLFHAMGKVLYNKRRPTSPGSDARPETPAEAILEHVPVDYDLFVLFLHQNYLAFTGDIDDAALASERLSDADGLVVG
ncbi:Rad17 cell cycle checkpoint protein-domain-containing protein, partial [Dimargaris cristalligena]